MFSDPADENWGNTHLSVARILLEGYHPRQNAW